MKQDNTNPANQRLSEAQLAVLNGVSGIPCADPACTCHPDNQKAIRLPVPIDPRLLRGHAVACDSSDMGDQLLLTVHRAGGSDALVVLTAQVLCDDRLDALIREPLLVQLRRAGEEAMLMTRMNPWQKDVLYVATVLWGLHMGLVIYQGQRHCCAGAQLRDIAEPALRQLQGEDPASARLLAGLMGWSSQEDAVELAGLRQQVLEGLRLANLLPQRV